MKPNKLSLVDTPSISVAPVFKLQSSSLGWGSTPILKALNLSVAEGEKVAIIGKSGAGKSTLIHSLHQQAAEKVALCGQKLGLVSSLSVFHNIYMGQLDKHHFFYNLANLIRPFNAEVKAITPLTDLLGLTDSLFKEVGSLSGGQQQRVALGRALFQNKTIFLGDEPVSSVDELQSEKLLALILSRHNTVILALHNIDLALRYCDRVIGLRGGTIELDVAAKDTSIEQLRSLYHD